VNQRSILTFPVALLVVAALAAPVWASDDEDDGDDGNNTPTTPFVQAPAPAPLGNPAPVPAATPGPVSATPLAAPESKNVPSRKSPNRAERRSKGGTPKRQVGGQVGGRRAVRAVQTSPVSLRTAPRGGVQAGAGGMARGR
jgi:hypothetical protein